VSPVIFVWLKAAVAKNNINETNAIAFLMQAADEPTGSIDKTEVGKFLFTAIGVNINNL